MRKGDCTRTSLFTMDTLFVIALVKGREQRETVPTQDEHNCARRFCRNCGGSGMCAHSRIRASGLSA